MTDTPKKRCLEREFVPDSGDIRDPKRPHAENTGSFLHLLQVEKTLAADDEEEECAPNEELVNGVMRSLEEEIAGTSCSSDPAKSGDNSAASETSSVYADQTLASDSGIDLCFLLEASDDELGIPPSPVLDLKDEACQFASGTSVSDLSETPDLENLGENWHFEDDFESYEQCVFEDAWDARQVQDYFCRDLVTGTLYDGSISAPWRLETAGHV